MPTLDDQRRAAGLEPLDKIIPTEKPPETKKERGHGRGKTTLHERPGQHPELRGVPLIGTGQGAVSGTRPGDSVKDLEQAARDIRHANEALAKAKAEAMRQARQALRTPEQTRRIQP